MAVEYISTRGETPAMGFEDAVATGLAPDGGLLVPRELPDLRKEFGQWEDLEYADLALAFFRRFAGSMDSDALERCVRAAHTGFSDRRTAPLRELNPRLFVLELFHGPTLAFKDFALQLLGNLYENQIIRTGEPINVLGATSGDTGAAAIHGLLGKSGVRSFILYPAGGVSALQERQMTCTGADTVYPLAIAGSFDDAQRIVKEIFGDLAFRRRYFLSAVNSINLARVLAQCVYYFYAYFQLPAERRADIEFVVPTGNFGNVLAGWWACRMGLPVDRFCVATNRNDILWNFFRTGVYEVGRVEPSLAPSMDIQVASNFERFLFEHSANDPRRVREAMATLRQTGRLELSVPGNARFRASRADDEGIRALTARVWRSNEYIVDPHTACGFADLDETKNTIVLGTAHPAKFPEVVAEATGQTVTHPTLETLKKRVPRKWNLPAETDAVKAFIAKKLS